MQKQKILGLALVLVLLMPTGYAIWSNLGTVSPGGNNIGSAGRIMQALFGTGTQLNNEHPWTSGQNIGTIGSSTGGGIFERLDWIQNNISSTFGISPNIVTGATIIYGKTNSGIVLDGDGSSTSTGDRVFISKTGTMKVQNAIGDYTIITPSTNMIYATSAVPRLSVVAYTGVNTTYFPSQMQLSRLGTGTIYPNNITPDNIRIGEIRFDGIKKDLANQYFNGATIYVDGGANSVSGFSTTMLFNAVGTDKVNREVMRLSGDGRVGIGTASPVAKLDVAGNNYGWGTTNAFNKGNPNIMTMNSNGGTLIKKGDLYEYTSYEIINLSTSVLPIKLLKTYQHPNPTSEWGPNLFVKVKPLYPGTGVKEGYWSVSPSSCEVKNIYGSGATNGNLVLRDSSGGSCNVGATDNVVNLEYDTLGYTWVIFEISFNTFNNGAPSSSQFVPLNNEASVDAVGEIYIYV